MRAFIIRPFGTKNDINFDEIAEKLIHPALDQLGVTGRETGEIVDQGNIRTDMFQMLLTADLVVADVSIHNANVFYELGVRHSLRGAFPRAGRAAHGGVPGRAVLAPGAVARGGGFAGVDPRRLP